MTLTLQVEAMTDSTEFAERIDPYRRELLAHCYRMMGSLDDAEDLVQDTCLRAWRAYGGFERRSSLRTWLYRIATNVCLTALQHRGRRSLPSGVAAPSPYPYVPAATEPPEVAWLQPIPDALAGPPSDDPAAVAEAQAGLRLALIAALQYLPPRQRAALILCEVLDWPAAEAAEALGTSTPALKSILQRARARLREVAPAVEDVVEPTAPEVRSLLETYINAFESSDVDVLAHALVSDAAIELIPTRTWFSGITTCVPFLAAEAMGARGDWRMLVTGANDQPAVAAYFRDSAGVHQAWGVAVLTCRRDGIARITVFGDPQLVGKFAFPTSLPTLS